MSHQHDDDLSSNNQTGIFQKIKETVSHRHSHDHSTTHIQTKQGIRAVKLSFLGLMITAILQVFVVLVTGSIALLADTLHNFSDAFTSIPLYIAYQLSQKGKTKRYTYGYGKVEDLAGLFIVLMIAFSAGVVLYESIIRLLDPKPLSNLAILAAASIIGFFGNEMVARYRISVGKSINSEALVADGLHSRTDALVSLSVLVSVVGVVVGYPQLDAIVGIFIGFVILLILKDTTPEILRRIVDGVDPHIINNITKQVMDLEEVQEVHNVRARWCGRELTTDFHIVINREYSVDQSHDIVSRVENTLKQNVKNLQEITIHIDPCSH